MCVFSISRHESDHLEHYADIELRDTVILQCELTKFSAVETILVLAIRKEAKEMLQFYQDKGVGGFKHLDKQQFMITTPPLQPLFPSQIVPQKRFTLFESDDGTLSLVAIYSEGCVAFIECNYQIF